MMAKINYKGILVHLVGWLIFTLLIGLLFYLQNGFFPRPIIFNISFGIILFYINYALLTPHFLLKRRILQYIILSLVLVAGITWLYTMFKMYIIFRNNPVFPTNYVLEVFLYMVLFLTGTAIRFYVYWLENENRKEKKAIRKVTSELQNLKNQLNPHFLFNSLNSIYSLTLKNSDKSSEAVIMLSELMRYMLYETNHEYVLLKKEIDYIENYFTLQQMQIADTKNVKLNISGAITNQKISPLLLISFIENAFKYGTDLSGKTMIEVDLQIKDYELKFNCKNNIGNRAPIVNNHSGIGIQNTIERLKLSYADKHNLAIEEIDDTFMVSLNLKLI